MKGCTVSVAATFEGGGKSDAETFDVCKEKSIRFTDRAFLLGGAFALCGPEVGRGLLAGAPVRLTS